MSKKLFSNLLIISLITQASIGLFAFPGQAMAVGTNYYVDNCVVTGNDSNNGTDSTTPWLTINKVNISSFSSGDTISFRKGCTWREQLTIPSSGSSVSPLTFNAYGASGANPIFNEANLLTTATYQWTSRVGGTNEYYAELSGGGDPSLTQPNQVFMNGSRLVSGTAGSLLDHQWAWAANGTAAEFPKVINAETGNVAQFTGVSTPGSATFVADTTSKNNDTYGFHNTSNGANDALGYYTLTNAQNNFYVRFYFTPQANFALTSGNSQGIFQMLDSAGTLRLKAYIKNNSGTYQIILALNGGATYATNITLGQSHYVEAHWVVDASAGGYEFWLDGVSKASVLNTNTTSQTIKTVRVGINGNNTYSTTGSEIYFDDIKLNTTGPIGAYQAGETGAASAFNTIIVRDDSGDPDTTSVSIEAGKRNYCISNTAHDYINISGIDCKYAENHGIMYSNSNHGTISNLEQQYAYSDGISLISSASYNLVDTVISHHNGHGPDGNYAGGGIHGETLAANNTVQNSTSYNNAEDGISFGGLYDVDHPETLAGPNNIITGNTCYNNTEDGVDIKTGPQTITNNTLYNNTDNGIILDYNIDGMTITGNDIYGNNTGANNGSGISFSHSGGTIGSTRLTIARNKIHNNIGRGIAHSGAYPTDFYNNLIYSNGGSFGVEVWNGVSPIFYNNVFWGDTSTLGQVRIGTSAVTFKNNIVGGGSSDKYTYYFDSATGQNFDYNILYGSGNYLNWNGTAYNSFMAYKSASSQDSHSLSTDPEFTTAGSNFTLLSTSPAIDTGTSLGDTYKLGLNPNSVWPSAVNTLDQTLNGLGWDIGAYVYTETTLPTVSLTAPTDGTTVSGASVTLSATASDNSAVAGVQFKLDTNTNIGAEDTTSTYGVTWDSTAALDGTHTLIAVARDTYGNYATSSAVTVTVSNAVASGGNGAPVGLLGQHTQNVSNPLAPTIPASTSTSLTSLQNQIASLTLQLNSLLSQTHTTTATSYTPYNFTRNLSLHATGADVRSLQQFLNANGFIISTTGAGSLGNETTLFGLLTYKALTKFQKSVSLPASGYFGPMTRAFLQKMGQ